MGGPDLAMSEVHRVMEEIQRRCEPAHVLMGAVVDEAFRERLALTLIVARKGDSAPIEQPVQVQPQEAQGRMVTQREELDTQLLSADKGKPGSRFVPPAPTLPPEQV